MIPICCLLRGQHCFLHKNRYTILCKTINTRIHLCNLLKKERDEESFLRYYKRKPNNAHSK